ncbi:MAG TPA: hypothetical protein VH933_00100 [Aestuariivirgaceae bacterium]|jgi:hypothetical protein
MTRRNALGTAALVFPAILLAALPSEVESHGRQGHDVLLQFEFGEYSYPERSWAEGGISCRGGGRIVHNRGFRDVRPIECDGRTFTYIGSWRGDVLKVLVDSATGRIIGVTPS